MATFRYGALTAACAVLLALAACAREGEDEMSWARSALERNNALEVVAADPHNRTFTVRVKDTGELRMVRADQLIATLAQSAAATAAAASPTPAPATGTTTPATAPAPEPPAAAASPASPAGAPQQGSLLPQTAPPVEAAPGRVLESGPGYTIKAAAPAAVTRTREATATSAITSAAVERRHEPIVCQGAQLLHIDNRNLVFDGDAVSAEDGCEIHITNSHISAGGVGILARAAQVHIDNSLIEGDAASIDASEGAQIYAASSRFRGLSRRLDTAAFHDLGGNVWN